MCVASPFRHRKMFWVSVILRPYVTVTALMVEEGREIIDYFRVSRYQKAETPMFLSSLWNRIRFGAAVVFSTPDVTWRLILHSRIMSGNT